MSKKRVNILLLVIYLVITVIGFIWMTKHEFPIHTDLYRIRMTIQAGFLFLFGGMGLITQLVILINFNDDNQSK